MIPEHLKDINRRLRHPVESIEMERDGHQLIARLIRGETTITTGGENLQVRHNEVVLAICGSFLTALNEHPARDEAPRWRLRLERFDSMTPGGFPLEPGQEPRYIAHRDQRRVYGTVTYRFHLVPESGGETMVFNHYFFNYGNRYGIEELRALQGDTWENFDDRFYRWQPPRRKQMTATKTLTMSRPVINEIAAQFPARRLLEATAELMATCSWAGLWAVSGRPLSLNWIKMALDDVIDYGHELIREVPPSTVDACLEDLLEPAANEAVKRFDHDPIISLLNLEMMVHYLNLCVSVAISRIDDQGLKVTWANIVADHDVLTAALKVCTYAETIRKRLDDFETMEVA